jgi:quinol monooxygenase YgiN
MANRLGIALFTAASLLLLAPGERAAAQGAGPVVVAVELEIVPAELENFKAAIKENGAACVREEAGCRMFNIAFAKDDPNRVLLFEVYESAEAVTAHQAAPAFKKYQATVANMVKSRKRTEMVPLALNAKGH